ncbi:MAG TPA: VOC family protein [Myxococcota bacterium]|nr:VOC family protein [Myxococcota bacterium]
MKKVTPFLWFDGKAAEAANFYVSIFKNSKLVSSTPMDATFVLDGQDFLALNGGPQYKFTPAVSLFVSCETQEEVDYFWEKLGAGGAESQCGWLTDKYGLSWQVVPTILRKLLQDPDRAKAQRALNAMLKMTKLDIKRLQEAFDAG